MNEFNRNIKKTDDLDTLNEAKYSVYKELPTPQNGNRRSRLLLILLFIATCFCGVLFVWGINVFDLNRRIDREFQNNTNNEIVTATGSYIGNTDFGYFFGDGTFNFNTGTIYNGLWDNNLMNGLGQLNVPNIGVYDGEFINSQKNGIGKFSWNDGAIYEGQWKNDKMDGSGTYIGADGVTYNGEFSENRFLSGTCEYVNETGRYIAQYNDFKISNITITFIDGSVYSGETDGISISGQGKLIYANKDQYEGNYSEGKRAGQGIYTWKSGNKYNGQWEDDKMDGAGTYTFEDGTIIEGNFDNNQFISGDYIISDSLGKYAFKIDGGKAVGVNMTLLDGTVYNGGIKDDNLTGEADITYKNGDTYTGSVEDGYKIGNGTYKWKNGASYQGEWSKDKMNGDGEYFYPNSESAFKLVGKFEDNVPEGTCKFFLTSVQQYRTEWSDGRCTKVYE